uniref:Lipocalin n=1 Tax=Rhipicephalus appendiculatus TaxID=34631 RepID=A0A131Z256_RHIAP
MSLLILLALCSVAPAIGVVELPIEDDPRFAVSQNVKAMTNIIERLYIVSRNYNITTPNRCHSAIKTAALSHDKIVVALRTHLGGIGGPPEESKSLFISLRTGLHKKDNAVIYRLHPRFHPALRKLMYIDPFRRCLILVERIGHHGRGCQLMMTESALDYPIPTFCMLLYRHHCPGPKVALYHPYCKYQDALIDRKAIDEGYNKH